MVIVRIAEGQEWPEFDEAELRLAIKGAIERTARLSIEHGYYSISKSQTTNSRYLARKRKPSSLNILRISDHTSLKASQFVNIIFPITLKEGRQGNLFFANALEESSLQEAFLMADTEVQRRSEGVPQSVASWILGACKFAA